jgi:uncharacterized phage protein (TIGR02218 family)
MSFDSLEQSQASGEPFELYLFQTTGQSFFLTSSDEEITYLGETYEPQTLRRDEMQETAEVDSGEIKVYIPTSHPLAELFIPGLPPAPVQLTIFAGHFGDSDILAIYGGSVASSAFDDECQLIIRSDKYLLNRKIPKQLYQGLCNHIFGDRGCGIDLALFTYVGVVASIDPTGTVITVAAFSSISPAGRLKGGYLAKGNTAARAILAHSGTSVTLMSPIAGLAVGDEVRGIAGCAHTYPACASYNNVPNFLGFDLIPSINPFVETTSLS